MFNNYVCTLCFSSNSPRFRSSTHPRNIYKFFYKRNMCLISMKLLVCYCWYCVLSSSVELSIETKRRKKRQKLEKLFCIFDKDLDDVYYNLLYFIRIGYHIWWIKGKIWVFFSQGNEEKYKFSVSLCELWLCECVRRERERKSRTQTI